MMKRFRAVTEWFKHRLVAAGIAAAIIGIAGAWMEVGWRPFLFTVVTSVGAAFDIAERLLLGWWVPWLIRLLNVVVPWHLELPPDWRNLFVMLTVYLSSHVREAWALNVPNRVRAFSWRIVAALAALVLATTAATILAGRGLSRLDVAVLSSAFGICVYRLGFAAQFAYDRSQNVVDARHFWPEFRRKALGALQIAVGSAVILGLAHALRLDDSRRWDFAWVLLLIACLGLFHLFLAWRSAGTTGNRNIGARIIEAVAISVLVLVIGTPFGQLFGS